MSKNEQTPLVRSVLALDAYLADLERIGAKIEEMPLRSEFDIAQIKRLMTHFAECGRGVSEEVTHLSHHLNEARARAEQVAGIVGRRATELEGLNADQQEKWSQFSVLNERVRALNEGLATMRESDDKPRMAASLARVDAELDPLIEEAQRLRQEARAVSLRSLEQNADALAQSLIAVRGQIREISAP